MLKNTDKIGHFQWKFETVDSYEDELYNINTELQSPWTVVNYRSRSGIDAPNLINIIFK